jgi:hypothetical protein
LIYWDEINIISAKKEKKKEEARFLEEINVKVRQYGFGKEKRKKRKRLTV